MILYDSPFGSSADHYAQLVEQSLEAAYAFFLDAGFDTFPGITEVEIVDFDSGELGAEYLFEYESGGWVPAIEIASEGVMEEHLAYAYVACSMEDLVASTCAHELFHVIQDYHSLQGTGDISEQSFVEPHATAVQELVVPSADDYLDPALDFLLAPDGISFFQRSYDAGIFWVYFLDRFGSDGLLDLMEASAHYDGRYAIDQALQPRGVTFLDIWSDFALSLATSTLPDSEVIATLVPEAEGDGWWTRTRPPAEIPPVVFRGTWTGAPLTIGYVNSGNASEYLPAYEDDAIGSPLRIAHAYGIDLIEVVVEATAAFQIEFQGDAASEFRAIVATETASGWSSARLETSLAVAPTTDMVRLRIVITRTEPGAGAYTLVLRPTQ